MWIHEGDKKRENDKIRKQLWIGVAVAVATTEAVTSKTAPGAWADLALANFDLTFKAKD